jgi:hypothetical protein
MNVASVAPGKLANFAVKDKHGRTLLAVVQKVSFRVDARGRVELDDDGPEPDLIDTYHGDDRGTSSIRKPSQLFEYKPGTDVLLLGHAHPPRGSAATSVDVSLTIGPIAKRARVHGLRVWQRGVFGGLTPGPGCAIREPIPLVYELAYGGMDLSDPEATVGEPRNTVGRGVARDLDKLIDQPAAQIEDPADPRAPVGFGAIHRHWQPRASFAGTYDEAWLEAKAPLLPDDFDPRHHVSVPPDQWSVAPLRGDEPCEVRGATAEGVWRFQLPRVALGFSSMALGKRTEHRTHLDTILIDADAGRIELTWRAAVPLPPKWEHLDQIVVFEKTIV